MSKTFLFQAIQFSQKVLIQPIKLSISIDFLCTRLNVKSVLFQAIQFSINVQFSSIWPIDRTLSGATTLGPSGPGSDGDEGMLRIPQNSSIIGASPVISSWGRLPLCREAVGVFYSPSRLGTYIFGTFAMFNENVHEMANLAQCEFRSIGETGLVAIRSYSIIHRVFLFY